MNIEYNKKIVGYTIDKFVVLTLQVKLLPIHISRKYAKEANDKERIVIFIPDIDTSIKQLFSMYKYKKILSRVASYSQDEVKTAVMTGKDGIAIAYTYNQQFNRKGVIEKFHAEQMLVDYVSLINTPLEDKSLWYMDLEPCASCLQAMISQGAQHILYMTNHKPKWNTELYNKLVYYIQNQQLKSIDNKPIAYHKVDINRTNKPNGIKPFRRLQEVNCVGFYNIWRNKDYQTYAFINKQWLEVTWCQPKGCYYVLY